MGEGNHDDASKKNLGRSSPEIGELRYTICSRI